MGKLNYTIPLLINCTNGQLNRLNTVINKACKVIMGNPCLKWTSERLNNRCGIKNIWHIIMERGLNMIHKIILKYTPVQIYEELKVNSRSRSVDTQIYTKYLPKTKKVENFYLYRIISIYNKLGFEYRKLDINDFKFRLKYEMYELFPMRKFPEYFKMNEQ